MQNKFKNIMNEIAFCVNVFIFNVLTFFLTILLNKAK